MFCVRLRESENRRRERRRFKKKGRHFGRKSEGKIVVSFNENEGYATRVQPHSKTRESENSYVLILSKGGAKTKNTQMRAVVSSSSRCYYYSYCFLRLLNFCFATVYSSLYVEEGGAGPDGALGGGGRGGGGAPEGA